MVWQRVKANHLKRSSFAPVFSNFYLRSQYLFRQGWRLLALAPWRSLTTGHEGGPFLIAVGRMEQRVDLSGLERPWCVLAAQWLAVTQLQVLVGIKKSHRNPNCLVKNYKTRN